MIHRMLRHTVACAALLVVSLAHLIAPAVAAAPEPNPAPSASAQAQPQGISFWGMNLYLTKAERARTKDNISLLTTLAQQAGVQWTREEMVWTYIEPTRDRFAPVYDEELRQVADAGFGIIGMLLTTPEWARDPSCRPTQQAYWCPPADPQEYAAFAGYMAERYDGDGVSDAPGSPRVAAWEVWNEPKDLGNWPEIGGNSTVRLQRYGAMLVGAYRAIKAANPSAIVLTGGGYIFDGGCANNLCDGCQERWYMS